MPGPPRAIEGTTGSRVRLVFGDTGKKWLLLLNEDDGNSKWQTQYWKSIPNAVSNQLSNCENKGRYAKEVDFGPNGDWFIHGEKWDGSGSHSWWNSPSARSEINEACEDATRTQVYFGSDCFGTTNYLVVRGRNGCSFSGNLGIDLQHRVKRINSKNKKIEFVRLFPNGGYFISDDEGTEWMGIGQNCPKELKGRGEVEEVAVAGDGSWVVLRPNHYVSSTGVDKALTKHLDTFYREQNTRRNRRTGEIRDYHNRIAREAREAAELAERERLARAAAEQAARERAEREARERQAREEAERRAREEAEQQAASSSRAAALEILLEERFAEEVKDIKQQEVHLRDQETRLQKQKRSLRDSMERMLPPTKRARLEESLNAIASSAPAVSETSSSSSPSCIVCHDHDAVRAVIPCGHHCLCDDCAATLATSVDPSIRLCPLCRGTLQGTLQIFAAN